MAPAQVTANGSTVVIDWSAPGGDTVLAASAAKSLATLRYGGYELPVELIRFQAEDGSQVVQLLLDEVEAAEWGGEPTLARPLTPPALDWDPSDAIRMDPADRSLPPSPMFIYSQSSRRGVETYVVAISPIFEEDGVIKFARRVRARMAGVRHVEDSLADLIQSGVQAASIESPYFAPAAELAPTNAAAAGNSVKLIVDERGIQSVSAQSLASVGFSLASVDKLVLTYNGEPIPLEVQDRNGNGKLDADDTLRFYAPGIGDYWNDREVYWLSDQGVNPARMAGRNVAPGSAPARTGALARGIWRNNSTYDSKRGGYDSDHWYAQRMQVTPLMAGKPAEYPRLTADITVGLPMSAGTSRITPHMTVVQSGEDYELQVKAGETKTATPSAQYPIGGDAIWSPTLNMAKQFSSIELVLIPTDKPGTLLVDSIDWEVPVHLAFGGKGAIFSGVEGEWQYSLSGLANGAILYDITDPGQPVRLTGMSSGKFQDSGARDYLVSGTGITQTPQVEAHQPVVFSANGGADALYIAPRLFMDELEPLVAHRRGQGYQVQVIDVQDIYDAWGYGHVRPEAIRDFLRFAVQQWQPSPISAVLVSDGTRDPFNYEKKESNVNYIPPYLISSFMENGREERLDPFLGQNGCETCYGELDGEHPFDREQPITGFMPDIWIGRFPAKDSEDVKVIVDKILRYETRTDAPSGWESRALFLADNYYLTAGDVNSGSPPPTDNAGDFIKYSEEVVALAPDRIRAQRLYFDPTADSNEPWRENSAVDMRRRVIAAMDSGPGLVTYNGHSAHWQWARTSDCAIPLQSGELCPDGPNGPAPRYDPTGPYGPVPEYDPDGQYGPLPPFYSGDPNDPELLLDKRNAPDDPREDRNFAPVILGLYDVDRLGNKDQLYVSLSMTCYTSQFFEPANSGTVLDERALVHPGGGAVASWGPAGLSVAQGHDDLQYGFHRALWEITETNPGSAKLGQLIEAGYVENQAPSCAERFPDDPNRCEIGFHDVRRTFLLLGDPLTQLRLQPSNDVYLPMMTK